LTFKTYWIDVSYVIFLTGKRYTLGENIEENKLSGYVEQNISISRDFNLKKIQLHFAVEMLNLSNENYEAIRNFPMQGMSFRVYIKLSKT
jgi:hypothetical protein